LHQVTAFYLPTSYQKYHSHLVNFFIYVEAAAFENMKLGKKGDQLQEDNMPSNTESSDIIYPSGIKLALLMTSIFVGMFLVALVCLEHWTSPGT